MLGRDGKPLSAVQAITHIHPFYSLIAAIAGPAMTFGLAPEFSPLVLVSFLFAKALVKEFRHVRDPARKTESIFREKTFAVDEIPMGKVTHYESQPVVEAYPIDGHLRALTKASLLAPYLLEFHIEYIRYLFAVVNTVYGAWSLDPGKAAINYINAEVSRRELNLEAVDADIYYMCKEIFKILKQYNEKAPFYLQRSEDEIDIDYCKALAAICGVGKGLGAEGCSTSVMSLADGIEGLAGNLDWFNALYVFHRYLVNMVEPTPHFRLNSSDMPEDSKENKSKPEMTFSSTIPGIIPAITVFNNLILVVVYNEVGAKKGNRQNGLNAWDGMILAKKIAEECATMEDVVALLAKYQPASTCNLIIAARDKHAVLQCMQYGSDKSFDMIDEVSSCVATNHFVSGERHMMRESAPIPDSKERHDKMTAEVKAQLLELQALHRQAITEEILDAIFEHLRQVCLKPTTKHDTVKTILAWLNYRENRCVVRMNTANFNASSAPNERGELCFDTLDLALIFKEFRKKVDQFHQDYAQSTGPEKGRMVAQLAVDQSLIQLMQTAHRISQKDPALASELRLFCTALLQELARSELSSSGSLSAEEIQSIAMETKKIINIMLDKPAQNEPVQDKASAWRNYKEMLANKLPPSRISYHPAKLPEALFRVFMCMCMDTTLKYLAEKAPSMSFANSFYSAFMATVWEKMPQYSVAFVASVCFASRSLLFKSPSLKTSSEKVVSALKEKLPKTEEKPSLLSRFGFGR